MERGADGRMKGTKKGDVCVGHGRASDSFLHSDEGKKELIGFGSRMQGQGGEEREKRGGGYYKNVKRALQPFSRRSAGGH